MNFIRLRTTHPLYQKAFGTTEIRGFEVVNQRESLGRIVDVLADDRHQSYHLVIESAQLFSRKPVLVPLSNFELEPTKRRIRVTNFNKAELNALPVYAATDAGRHQLEGNLPLETSAPLEASLPLTSQVVAPEQHPNPPSVHTSASLTPTVTDNSRIGPASPDRSTVLETKTIPLLQERLLVERHRRKLGEVIVRKVVETRIVEVPVRREKLIVEQISPEQKQLAVIDLNGLTSLGTGIDLHLPAAQSMLEQAHHSGSIPITLAQQILQKISHSKFNQAQVQLVFSDPELQAHYHHWLDQHRSEQMDQTNQTNHQ
jgi:hypothetical protein